MEEKRLSPFSHGSGTKNWTIASLRSCGPSKVIASPSALHMNPTTIQETGFALMETRIGSSTNTALCDSDTHVSTIYQFGKQIVSSAGHSAGVLMDIPD